MSNLGALVEALIETLGAYEIVLLRQCIDFGCFERMEVNMDRVVCDIIVGVLLVDMLVREIERLSQELILCSEGLAIPPLVRQVTLFKMMGL
ncbi:MAG: hypothetical protein Hyperionvirus31_11 [Hyperionvirus sp.]|uniref:Uncharacterized protein n=1 Tax=Hyperionvirus sp. TaxID=2487770 RepID=A0A3G5AEC5_9VIRU|nr:MAG: hypothetical protein Hyperionvirus31_11 [Hyperionvirus sp.]